MATHEVFNQPPPHEGYDAFGDDVALREAVDREGGGWAAETLHHLGRDTGDAEWIRHGRLANEQPPELATHDRFGHRIDEVVYHPAYHRLMQRSVEAGIAGGVWDDDRSGAHVARAAAFMLACRIDAGHCCPISMTYSAVPALRTTPTLAQIWEPKIRAATYEAALAPVQQKHGVTFGMAMTEKQGGSDVRANTTWAEPTSDGSARLTGHKWFCSAPMSDAFLVLAQGHEGLSCYLVPRVLDDGSRNVFRIQRLKDKLGDRSNASSEIEFDGTVAHPVGTPGGGVRTIIEMVGRTRLDCALGAAAMMRHGLSEAAWHVHHREAFGKRLSEQPLMRTVIADLAVESEAATLLALRLAGAFDRAALDDEEERFRRVAMPITKYWLCKRAPVHVAEALECLGGNGFVEESGLPRVFRQSPLNGIWEGSGNVQCLDVLRALARIPGAADALFDELELARGADPRLDAAIAECRSLTGAMDEGDARLVVERLALTLQGALLVRHSHPDVADAFCGTRLDGRSGLAFGAWPRSARCDAIITRAVPAL